MTNMLPVRYYPVPEWFQVKANHKAMFIGPDHDRLKIPACKMFRRECWPNDGCWEPADQDTCKRNWKDVTCTVCRNEIPWLPGAGPNKRKVV